MPPFINLVNNVIKKPTALDSQTVSKLFDRFIKPKVFQSGDWNFGNNEEKLKLPCIVDGLATNWPAVKEERWTIPNLQKFYGKKYFQCGSFGREPIVMTLNNYVERYVNEPAANQCISDGNSPPNPLYLFDPTFEYDNEIMLTDYEIPHMFSMYDKIADCLPENSRSNYKWFLVGPRNSGSDLHVDPLHTSAWNTTVIGHKLWLIVEPAKNAAYESDKFSFDSPSKDSYGVPHDQMGSEDIVQYKDWFESEVPSIIDKMRIIQPNRKVYLFVQQPGETVFIPSQWLHAVLNLDTTVAITHNFIQPIHIEYYLREYQITMKITDEERDLIKMKMNSVID